MDTTTPIFHALRHASGESVKKDPWETTWEFMIGFSGVPNLSSIWVLAFVLAAKTLNTVRCFADRAWVTVTLTLDILDNKYIVGGGSFNLQSSPLYTLAARLSGGLLYPVSGLTTTQTILTGLTAVFSIVELLGVMVLIRWDYLPLPDRLQRRRVLSIVAPIIILGDISLMVALGFFLATPQCTNVEVWMDVATITVNGASLLDYGSQPCGWGTPVYSAFAGIAIALLSWILLIADFAFTFRDPPRRAITPEFRDALRKHSDIVAKFQTGIPQTTKRLTLAFCFLICVLLIGSGIFMGLSYMDAEKSVWIGHQTPTRIVVPVPSAWTFSDAYFFTLSTILAIGYGNMVPTSTASQTVLIFFSVIGLAASANYLIAATDFIRIRLERDAMAGQIRFGESKQIRHFWLLFRIIVILALYWLLGAVIMMVVESWSYFDSVYFMYTSGILLGFSTILPQTAGGWEILSAWLMLLAPIFAVALSGFQKAFETVAMGREKTRLDNEAKRRETILIELDRMTATI
jgi:hypothetical protein